MTFCGKFAENVKLVIDLHKKERYVVHYRNLKLYKQLGMNVIKIHKALKFQQVAWIAPYIQLNTDPLTKATSEFEKDFFKLMNNSVFGKNDREPRQKNQSQYCTNFRDRQIA